MKNERLITSIIFSLITLNYFNSQSQIFTYINDINSHIQNIPYVFEGQVTSVEVFAGDDYGNKLPKSSAVWNGDIGYFYDQTGKEAKGYSLARIKVCKLYKGSIREGEEIKILTKSFTLDNVYLLRTGSGATADTTIQFLNVPPSHDENHEFDFILPHNSYSKKIYFSDRLDNIMPFNYGSKEFYSNFHSIYELPFNVPIDMPQSDGSYKRIDAYCALIPYVFDDQNQLQLFLNQINTINPNPVNYCNNGEVKNINPTISNENNLFVKTNPSSINENVIIINKELLENDFSTLLNDVTGNQILNYEFIRNTKFESTLRINNILPGIYFLKIKNGSEISVLKIIKN